MTMSDKEMVNMRGVDRCFFQLPENTVSASGVHHKIFFSIFNREAGIIILGHHGISSAEDNQFFCFHIVTSF